MALVDALLRLCVRSLADRRGLPHRIDGCIEERATSRIAGGARGRVFRQIVLLSGHAAVKTVREFLRRRPCAVRGSPIDSGWLVAP